MQMLKLMLLSRPIMLLSDGTCSDPAELFLLQRSNKH
jgi:hypothetical protein